MWRTDRAPAGAGEVNEKMAEQFVLRAGSSAQWQGAARSLKDCADLVFRVHLAAVQSVMSGGLTQPVVAHLSTGRVFFLLAGLAIENLVKGLIVQRTHVKINRRSLPRELRGHGIAARLRRLDIKLSSDEEKLVRRLEIAVSWAGRYPVPLDAARMLGTGTITRVTDAEEFGAFYQRLEALLSTTPPGSRHWIQCAVTDRLSRPLLVTLEAARREVC
jgi:hypothetical protein